MLRLTWEALKGNWASKLSRSKTRLKNWVLLVPNQEPIQLKSMNTSSSI